MPAYFWVIQASGVAFATLASICELRTKHIPNVVTGAGMVWGAALLLFDHALLAHLGGFVVAALPGVLVYLRRAIGGGALKSLVALAWMVGGGAAFLSWLLLALTTLPLVRVRLHNSGDVPATPFMLAAMALGTIIVLAHVPPGLATMIAGLTPTLR
jgi:hypothetical protein